MSAVGEEVYLNKLIDSRFNVVAEVAVAPFKFAGKGDGYG